MIVLNYSVPPRLKIVKKLASDTAPVSGKETAAILLSGGYLSSYSSMF